MPDHIALAQKHVVNRLLKSAIMVTSFHSKLSCVILDAGELCFLKKKET